MVISKWQMQSFRTKLKVECQKPDPTWRFYLSGKADLWRGFCAKASVVTACM